MVLLDTAGRGQGLETVILEGVLDRGGRCAPGGVRRKAKGLRLNWSFRYQGTEKKTAKVRPGYLSNYADTSGIP